MTLRFNLLGFEVANIHLDFGDLGVDVPRQVTVLDRGIKKMSGFWVGRMNR
jgi:hypothetical protein